MGSIAPAARALGACLLGLCAVACVGSGGPPLPPASLELVMGDRQVGVVGTALPTQLSVLVRDELGRPSEGVAVTFVVVSGEAMLNPSEVATGRDGRAATLVTLGSVPGEVLVEASVAGGSVRPTRFTLAAEPGAPTFLTMISGDGQRGVPGDELPEPLVVAAEDRFRNPVPRVNIAFFVTSGGGRLTPASGDTGMDGRFSTRLTLPTWLGPVVVEARGMDLAGSPLRFNATVAMSRPAAFLVLSAGDAQRAPISTRVPAPLVVQALDGAHQPVAKAEVRFAVEGGGDATVTAPIALTGDDGLAKTFVDLGRTSGPLQVSASLEGALGSPQRFTLTATAGPAYRMTYAGGDEQRAVIGSILPRPFAVKVADAVGNPVVGTQVAFRIVSGEGTLSARDVATGEDGIAATTMTLPRIVGATLVRASVEGGLLGSPVDFRAVAQPAPAAFLTLHSGGEQRGVAGSTLPQPIKALVSDAFQNAVSGVEVTFAVTQGGARMSNMTATSGPDGTASTTVTLGDIAGTSIIEARSTGLVGSPVVTRVHGTAGPAARLQMVAGDAQRSRVGTTLPQALEVVVVDQLGNGVPNIFVEWAVTSGSATVPDRFTLTDSDGFARTPVQLGVRVGPVTLEARAAVLGSPVLFQARARLSDFPTLWVTSGDRQSGRPGTTLRAPLVATLRDPDGEPLYDTEVAFEVTDGEGSLSRATVVTDGSGLASTELTLGQGGTTVVMASALAVGAIPVTFTATTRNFTSLGYVETLRNGLTLETLPLHAVDVLVHAFVVPAANGTLTETGSFAAQRLAGIAGLAHAAGKQIIMSVGGATGSTAFAAMAASASARSAFISGLLARLRDWDYDGVDLDWEFPSNATERASFTRLAQELRATLSAASNRYILAFGISTGQALDYYDFPALAAVTDFGVYFGYDWNNPACGPMENTTSYTSNGGSTFNASVKGALNFILGRGYPASKLLIGIPFYSSSPSRSWFEVRGRWSTGSFPIHPLYRESLIDGTWWTVPLGIEGKLDATLEPGLSVLTNQTTLGGLAIWELGHEGGYSDLSDAVADWLAAH